MVRAKMTYNMIRFLHMQWLSQPLKVLWEPQGKVSLFADDILLTVKQSG